MRFGMLMSPVVKVLLAQCTPAKSSIRSRMSGRSREVAPVREHGCAEPELVTVHSSVPHDLVAADGFHFGGSRIENPGRKIAVLLPELVVRHWWENLLHNQRVQLLKLLLLLKGNQRIVVVNIPWYL